MSPTPPQGSGAREQNQGVRVGTPVAWWVYMKRIACGLVLVLAASACGVGGDDKPGDGSDDRFTKLGIVCNSMMQLAGSFTPGTPGRPLDLDTNQPITGCWPVGTWTFNVTTLMNGCA